MANLNRAGYEIRVAEIRSPKSEIRKKSQIPNPKPEEDCPRRVTKEHEEEGRRVTGFGLLVAGKSRVSPANSIPQPATSSHLFVSLRDPSWIILLLFWDFGFGFWDLIRISDFGFSPDDTLN
jgi:hypothetical protein